MGDKMKKALDETQKYFVSASNQTPEYLICHKLFKKEFTEFLKKKGATDIEFGNPNHFDINGFFRKSKQLYYFSISDLRWSKETMLIRTAKHKKDYTGGSNCYCRLYNIDCFELDFDNHTKDKFMEI